MKIFLLTIVLLCSLPVFAKVEFYSDAAIADGTGKKYSLIIRTSETNITDLDTGHASIVIDTTEYIANPNMRPESLGFYPNAEGVFGYNGYIKDDSTYPNITNEVTIYISRSEYFDAQVAADNWKAGCNIMSAGRCFEWDSWAVYNIFTRSCVHFVKEVVESTGLPIWESTSKQIVPTNYLALLVLNLQWEIGNR